MIYTLFNVIGFLHRLHLNSIIIFYRMNFVKGKFGQIKGIFTKNKVTNSPKDLL